MSTQSYQESFQPRAMEGGGEQRQTNAYKLLKIIVVVIASIACFALLQTPKEMTFKLSDGFASVVRMVEREVSSNEAAFRTKLTNAYTKTYGPAGIQYPWAQNSTVFEPYREITVELYGSLLNDNGLRFLVSIAGEEYSISPESPVFIVTLEEVGRYTLTATATEIITNRSVEVWSEEIICKYVRRELRDLLHDDREHLLSAMEITYRVPTSLGQQLYGPDYQSAGEFIKAHNYMAGQRSCDHMHDGLGFLTLHTALTMQYEKVLRLIHPSIVMHYWDYTIDSERYYDQGSDIQTFYNSEIFMDEWFGGVVFDDNTVSNGRFPYVSLDPAAYNIEPKVKNGYGLLRSPWNQNSIPFLTRCNKTYSVLQSNPPGCEWHFGQMKLTDWADFGNQIQYRPHGKVHTLIAGVWGADWPSIFEEKQYVEYNHGEALALGGFGYQKDMWRSGLLECPSECSKDTPMLDCKCHCPELQKWIHDEAGPKIMKVAEMVDDGKTANALGEDMSKTFMRLLCNDYEELAPVMGDLMNSGAPADPIFWTIHPTVDRLWQWRRINGMTNESWPPSSENYVHGGDCWGHSADDVTIFKNIFDSDERFYSNQDLYDLMDPLNEDRMDAIYDSFRWGHCQHVGYPIDLLPSKFVPKDSGIFTGSAVSDCDKNEPYHEGHC
mmetsp:Transcript_29511/g.40051  ORF Transcript_29511/g.40051 Transcript_29511/m.40051 type:complete len:664 (-) Transcript_29511:227-2218(-)